MICSCTILNLDKEESIHVCLPVTLLTSEESGGCFAAKISMMRFASWANSCRGSTFELRSSLALLTIVAASDDIARLRRSSNSSSETSPIWGKKGEEKQSKLGADKLTVFNEKGGKP
jgi:hypothetical protein